MLFTHHYAKKMTNVPKLWFNNNNAPNTSNNQVHHHTDEDIKLLQLNLINVHYIVNDKK